MISEAELQPQGGALAENMMHFARALRAAGLPVGPGAILDAVAAVQLAGLRNRQDFRAALEAVFVKKREQRVVFDVAFRMFWKRRGFLEQLTAMMSPADSSQKTQPPQQPEAAAARVAQALALKRDPDTIEQRTEPDRRFTVSPAEVVQKKDFAQMSAEEMAFAISALSRLKINDRPVRSLRFVADRQGASVDLRRSLRHSLRGGGDAIELLRRARSERLPPVVALCDISGSMSDYTRVFLHFLHVLSAQRNVQSFLFGTRLTNVTRALRFRDPDEALARCAEDVADWSGGTRIGSCLHTFNRDWSRRVLAQGATVLLFTDGLEREGVEDLSKEIERLHKSCRRLIWLNPLLRYEAFQAKASGVRAMLPHVDEFRPVHNLASIAGLCDALQKRSLAPPPRRWLSAA